MELVSASYKIEDVIIMAFPRLQTEVLISRKPGVAQLISWTKRVTWMATTWGRMTRQQRSTCWKERMSWCELSKTAPPPSLIDFGFDSFHHPRQDW